MSKCDILGRRASLVCLKCGTFYCMSCHARIGKVGVFSGKCGKCAGKVIRKR